MALYIQIAIFIPFWFITASLIIRKNWREREVNSGLTILYIVNLFLIHGFAALLYLLPWHRYINGKWMLNGFREATYGASAFGIGNLILAPFIIRLLPLPRINRNVVDKTRQISPSKLPKIYFLIGVISYFILSPIVGGLPTVTSLVAAGHQLMIVGLCLICWQAWYEKNKKKFRRWLLISFSLPFISIIFQGYLGAGLMMTLIVLFFVARFFRPKWKVLIIGVVLVYLGLSLYLTYMRDREELRAIIWGGGSLTQRINSLKVSLSNPIWFNLFNLEQLEVIDSRMNQNILLGAGVEYISSGKVDYAYGETIWESVLALIPRAFWREKRIFAGSPGVVSKYTGMTFSEETSVGIGQVMEFYINFGRMGVIIGFLVTGIIIAIIDTMAGYYLAKDNLKKFILWFLPGLSSLMCGSFVEVTSSAGAAISLVFLITSRNLLIGLLILYFLMQVIGKFVVRLLPF